MQMLMDKKAVNVLPPAAIIDNASATCNVIDRLDYDELELIVSFGAMDIAMVALKLQESDVKASATALTGGGDVPGTLFGTSVNDTGAASTLPSATDDNKLFSFHVDLRGRKRYLLPTVTCGDGSAGTYVTAIGLLSRAKDAPRTAVEAGYAQRMCV